MELLTEEQIIEELAETPGWSRQGDAITAVTERADFKDALLYVGAVAFLAERANHHPDVLIQWNKVTLSPVHALGRRPDQGGPSPWPGNSPPWRKASPQVMTCRRESR